MKLRPIPATEGAFHGASTSKPAEASQVTKGASLSSSLPPAGDEVIWVRPDWNDNPLLLLLSLPLFSLPLRHCGGAGPGPPPTPLRPMLALLLPAPLPWPSLSNFPQAKHCSVLSPPAFLSSGRKIQKLILTRCPLPLFPSFLFLFSFLEFAGWGFRGWLSVGRGGVVP